MDKTRILEDTEWCQIRFFNCNDTSLPRVLLIGDSITVGYSTPVRDMLEGKANVGFAATSKCVSDLHYLTEIEFAVNHFDHSVIHFNNGLHGWGVTEDAYAQHLETMVQTLKNMAPNAALVWAHSTPVRVKGDPDALNPERNPRVVKRNAIATEIMNKHEIPINDLYSLMLGKKEYFAQDGCHFNDSGKAVQGENVRSHIMNKIETC